MPIRPEMRELYPPEWPLISSYIRFDRALGRCECDGRCGSPMHRAWISLSLLHSNQWPDRCPNYHGDSSQFTGNRVVLTTMHLDHDPTNCVPENLMAGCQACHLAYDADHHTATKTANREKRDPQMSLLDPGNFSDGPAQPPPEPEQCGRTLRCRLIAGHDTEPGAQTIARDHWAPHGGALQVNRDGQVGALGAYWKSEASEHGARELATDDPAEAQQVLDLTRLILADPYRNDHLLHMDDTGWTLKHPIAERLNGELFECGFNLLSDALSSEWGDEANTPGVYKVSIIQTADGDSLGIERTPDRD